MTKFAQIAFLAVALFSGAASTAFAYGDSARMACQNGSLTPNGVWDCR